MKIISFELTMPNRGSWNSQWSGQDRKYYIIKKVSDRYLSGKDHFKDLLEKGKDNWHYSWSDGWGANIKAEIINSTVAKNRRKVSKGFCGYDWMVGSIMVHGEIMTEAERKIANAF